MHFMLGLAGAWEGRTRELMFRLGIGRSSRRMADEQPMSVWRDRAERRRRQDDAGNNDR